MLTVSKDKPLLTTITGSLPRPHWFGVNLAGRPFSAAMTEIAFREQYTDGVAAFLSDQAAMLSRAEAELPRVEVTSPSDRPPYCITLQTVIAFVARLKAHTLKCPLSNHAGSLAHWERTQADYTKLFNQYRCRPTP